MMDLVVHLVLWFVILNLQRPVFSSVACIGENGHPVDWFIVYKLPRIKHSADPYLANGVGYIYMDSSSYRFKMPSKSINSTNSTVGYTLQQIYISYQRSGDIAFLMYNDEDASGREFLSKAHSKGVLGLDTTSGFWLVHSVPKFPPFAKDGYSYPETAQRYGQSFLCVTFKMLTFNDIGLQLLYNGPAIYDYILPKTFESDLPNIKNAIDGKFITSKPYSHVAKLSSLENVKYTSFAKSKHFGADLYHDLVALFYNASLLAETWQHGENLPSNCSVPTVENIKELKFMDISFKEAEDHSKWTISKSEYLGLVCIGDINRMRTQFKRGGGTLCVVNGMIWKTFNEAIITIEQCHPTPNVKADKFGQKVKE